MKTKNLIAIIALALVVPFTACNDDKFLEEHPETFYTVDNAISTSSQVDQVLVSIYSHLRDVRTAVGEDQWIFNLRGKGTDMYDVAILRKGDTFSDYSVINTTTGTFYEVYTTWYYVIGRANLALYAAELPQLEWASAADKAYAVAQARFFRAFAYKMLAELFGGVPLVKEIEQTPRYDYKRETRIATYQFAIDEMEAILDDLPETTAADGRIVRAAAQHNLAELYIAMGTQMEQEGTGDARAAYNTAVSYANAVIDGGLYSLVNTRFGTKKDSTTITFPIHTDGSAANPIVGTVQTTPNHYWDLFQEGNVNYNDGNTEAIWTIQIDYAAYRKEDGRSKLAYARSYGPVFRDVVARFFGGTLEDVGGRGISSVNITNYTRDLIYADKWGDDIRNSEAVFRRIFKGNKKFDKDNVTPNPYYLKVVPWDVIYQQDEAANRFNVQSEVHPVSCKIATNIFTGVADGENMSNLFRDEYMVRLPETILLRAEAKQRLGNKAGAADDVNLLRTRAQCSYLVTAADMDDNFDMILDERARELVYEEYRWNTLLRMGGTIAVDRIRRYAYWPETAATLTFNYNLWPIPQTIIDTNKDVKMEQNPGWENR